MKQLAVITRKCVKCLTRAGTHSADCASLIVLSEHAAAAAAAAAVIVGLVVGWEVAYVTHHAAQCSHNTVTAASTSHIQTLSVSLSLVELYRLHSSSRITVTAS